MNHERGQQPQNHPIISQTFVPDPASVGQHMADVAQEMARHGHRVIVFTANRGYENPRLRYPTRQTVNGVDIRRLPFSSFGKRPETEELDPNGIVVQAARRPASAQPAKSGRFSNWRIREKKAGGAMC